MLLGTLLLLTIAGVSACGGEAPGSDSLSPAEVLQRAHEAMVQQEGFAAAIAGLPADSPLSLQYGAADLLKVIGDGGVDCPHHVLLAGNHVYGSEVGLRWKRDVCREMVFWRLSIDPRDQLGLAINLLDEGTRTLDGRLHRVITAELDVDRFYAEYLPAIQDLLVRVSVRDSLCIRPREASPVDRERLEGLGYRVLEDDMGPCFDLFKDNVHVEIHSAFMDFRVRGAAYLSQALREDFGAVVEAVGLGRELVNQAEVSASTGGRELFLDDYRGRRLRFWIDAETYLASQIESAGHEGQGALSFDYRAPVQVEMPTEIMDPAEAQALSNATQDSWKVLWNALEAYVATHDGLHPDELTLESLGEALASQGLSWPTNPFTGEPMRDTAEDSPGDFHYEPAPDRLDYRVKVYSWDGPAIYRPLQSELPAPLKTPAGTR